jgi:hypothetical protein
MRPVAIPEGFHTLDPSISFRGDITLTMCTDHRFKSRRPDGRPIRIALNRALKTVLVPSLYLLAFPAHAEKPFGDHPSVAAAIAATPDGGRLVFPAGDWECPDTSGWYINKTIEISGSGTVTGYETSGTRLRFHDAGGARRHANSTIFRLGPLARGVYIHDLVLTSGYGPAPGPGTGDAIRYEEKAIITELTLERVKIAYAGRDGIHLAPDSFVVSATLLNVGVQRCGGDGLMARGVTALGIYSSGFSSNDGAGVRLTACGSGTWVGSWAASNCSALTNPYYDGQVVLENCHGFALMGGGIEDFVRKTVRNGIVLNACSGVTLGGLSFGNPAGGTAAAGSRSVILLNGTRGCAIQPSSHNYVDIAIEVHKDGTSTGNVIFTQPVAFPQLPGTSARLVIAPDQKTLVVK